MNGSDSDGSPAAEIGFVGSSSVAKASIRSVSFVFCGNFPTRMFCGVTF